MIIVTFKLVTELCLKYIIEKDHNEKYETCGGNCSDRMYEENTFECKNCETMLCKICSQSDKSDYCWGCDNLLCEEN